MTNYRMRQQDILPDDVISELSVTIVGCGGIGSHTALALARMGVTDITLIDPDAVSTHNVSSQGFDIPDIGKSKVEATRDKMIRAARCFPKTRRELVVEGATLRTRVVIAAVDSQKARKDIFNAARRYTNYIIMPAMGAEMLTLTTYPMVGVDYSDSCRDFDSTWFNDADAVQESCTAKATIYTTLMVSSYIAKIVKDIAMNNNYVASLSYDIANNTPLMMFDNNGINLME